MSTLLSSLITKTLRGTSSDIVFSSAIIVVLGIIAWCLVIGPAIAIIMSLRMRVKSKDSTLVTLEIIPPRHSGMSPEGM